MTRRLFKNRAGVATLEALVAFAIIAATAVTLHQVSASARATMEDAQFRRLAAEEALSTAARLRVDAPWPPDLAQNLAQSPTDARPRQGAAVARVEGAHHRWRRGPLQLDAHLASPASPSAPRALVVTAEWRTGGRVQRRRYHTVLPPRRAP